VAAYQSTKNQSEHHYDRTGGLTIIVSLFLFLRLFLSHNLGLDHDQLDHYRMCA